MNAVASGISIVDFAEWGTAEKCRIADQLIDTCNTLGFMIYYKSQDSSTETGRSLRVVQEAFRSWSWWEDAGTTSLRICRPPWLLMAWSWESLKRSWRWKRPRACGEVQFPSGSIPIKLTWTECVAPWNDSSEISELHQQFLLEMPWECDDAFTRHGNWNRLLRGGRSLKFHSRHNNQLRLLHYLNVSWKSAHDKDVGSPRGWLWRSWGKLLLMSILDISKGNLLPLRHWKLQQLWMSVNLLQRWTDDKHHNLNQWLFRP